MKKRLFIILLILLFPIFISNVQAKEGWVEENGEKYYYENDKPISGFKEIDGNTYFFGITTNKLLHGWQYWNGKFYLDKDGKVNQGWNTIDGEKYYVRDNYLVNKFQEIDGNTYFFGLTTYKLLHGWQYWNGKFYLDGEGKVTQGWNTINGEKYYVRDNYLVNKFQEIDGNTYFFGLTTYKLLHGWQYWNGKFYLDGEGKVTQGWNTINGEKYYVRNNYLVNGWVEDNGEDYFLGLTTYKLLHGWQYWNGKFYLDKDGKAKKGWNDIDGAKYYVKSKYLVKGMQDIDGEKYFFGNTTYKLLYGWQGSTDGYWYQDNTGKLLRGLQTLNDRQYKFNDTTGYLEGFKKENGKLYYYNPDGTQAKGVEYMMDRFWKFNTDTGAFEKIVRQIRVIDVSHNNGDIDWEKVKASKMVDAVVLRIGFGIGYEDNKFEYNKSELDRLGIPYTVYLFSYAENKNEALKESNSLISIFKKYKANVATNIFSIYYDLEDWYIRSTGENSNGISKSTYGEMITEFIQNTEKNLKIRTRVYASPSFIEARFPDYVKNYVTWIADWRGYLGYDGPHEGWQYSSTGSIPGIKGDVDLNYFYY